MVVGADPHGLAGLPVPLPSSHRTVPRVRPMIMVLGFAAAGSAGKASPAPPAAVERVGLPGVESLGVGCDDDDDNDEDDDGCGGFDEEGASQGVAPARPAPALWAEDAGIDGNGFAAVELPQLPCLLTADRDD